MIKSTEVQLDMLCSIIESNYGVKREDFLSKCRKRELVNYRRILMVILKKHTKESLASIVRHLGGKDHATVLHAVRTHENLMIENQKTCIPVEKEYAEMFAVVYSEYLVSLDSTLDKISLKNVLLTKIETMKKQVERINEQLAELNRYRGKAKSGKIEETNQVDS